MEARERIRKQLDILFADAPQNRAAWELQEELLTNCLERYQDLVKEGMDEEEALQNVMGSVGNVDELIAALPDGDNEMRMAVELEQRQRSGMIVAISVGLYILAGVVLLVGALVAALTGSPNFTPGFIGLILAVIICIFPTCMLVYNAHNYPRYKKKDETVVEEFKAWSNDTKKVKMVRGAVSSMLWTLTVLIYLLVSFTTRAWYITWIIFLVSTCIETAINLFFRLREMH